MVIFKIHFLSYKCCRMNVFVFLNVIVWIELIFNKEVKWYNSNISNPGFAFSSKLTESYICINLNNNCMFMFHMCLSTEYKIILIIYILKLKSFEKWSLEIVQFPLCMFIRKPKMMFQFHLFYTYLFNT